MTTEVILTGTGTPHPAPGRAGAGTLVRAGSRRPPGHLPHPVPVANPSPAPPGS